MVATSLASNILFVANILNTVTVEELLVPELVQIGNASEVLLDCLFTAPDDNFTLRWYHNRSDGPVYQWSPGTEPQVSGVLDGRLDMQYRASPQSYYERRALRVIKLDPELSGEYTCSITRGIAIANQTKTMLVFSPEKEFTLEFHRNQVNSTVNVTCLARGVYPQPELAVEIDRKPIPKQHQRVWRSQGVSYDAETTALLKVPNQTEVKGRFTCRLDLPVAGYTAIKEDSMEKAKGNSQAVFTSRTSLNCIMIFFYTMNY